ncbi:uncharacterized protein LOC124132406 isoform X3 [Haliotis rufescens]|uniref:uncharacterized protein LOC124132406 isoform X3 n=1 Tax=Haliotis rufescens TaxID=6454 RepID=UPI00201EA4FF|nr:uncharacterized protein LOC124132406 isoform X3 [Haliotis rufescens]
MMCRTVYSTRGTYDSVSHSHYSLSNTRIPRSLNSGSPNTYIPHLALVVGVNDTFVMFRQLKASLMRKSVLPYANIRRHFAGGSLNDTWYDETTYTSVSAATRTAAKTATSKETTYTSVSAATRTAAKTATSKETTYTSVSAATRTAAKTATSKETTYTSVSAATRTAAKTATSNETASPKEAATINDAATIKQTSTTAASKPLPPPQRPPCNPGTIPHKKFLTYNNSHPLDVTVVTAYFNLGRFRKGSGLFFDTQLYMSWSGVFKHLRNPFVFYTDSEDIAKQFQQMRIGKEGITKIVLVDRKNLWAFGWVDRIKKIYSNPGYPKFHPNTVVPEYSCAQHAKYESVEAAVKSNYFNTTYYTWIDIGYFRYILKRGKEFVIVKPQGFNESRVAMNKVNDVNMDTSPETVFKGNHVWLGGGMLFGSKFTLPIFIADYRQAVQHYLDMSLSSTDQQVIFSMNTNKEKLIVKQRVTIQQYVADVPGDCWFYLGYACYRELVE